MTITHKLVILAFLELVHSKEVWRSSSVHGTPAWIGRPRDTGVLWAISVGMPHDTEGPTGTAYSDTISKELNGSLQSCKLEL